MYIGIPKERRPFEYRVGMSPAGVEILAQRGHTIYVEHDAGVGAGFSDQEYEKAGARLAYSAEEVFARADLLLKMARPFKSEMSWLKPGAVLAGFPHLASAKRDKIDVLIEKKITSVAYEQIMLEDGSLPVLRPFSQIGGLMAAQISARLLQNNWGGKGILMGGVPGVPPAEVVVLGGGVVGMYATQGFIGLGAHVTVLDLSMNALQRVAERFAGVTTMMSTKRNIERATFIEETVQKHSGQTVLAVCHGGVMDAIFDYCFGVGPWRRCEIHTYNTGISHFEYIAIPGRETWRLYWHNMVEHFRLLEDSPA